MRLRSLLVLIAVTLASSACTSTEGGGIEVVDVSGPLDARALRFMADSIDQAGARGRELVLLQINSPAVLDGEGYDRLLALLADPPLPVASWVGPGPAKAQGGAAEIAIAAGRTAIAPGSTWGVVNPVVLGEDRPEVIGPTDVRPAEELPSGTLEPTIRQYVEALDGEVFPTAAGAVEVSTLTQGSDGPMLKTMVFRKPGLVDRFFRVGVLPEAAFFFLVVGLTILVFEFYALGPGVAAGVAGVSLLIGGWGLVNLPTRWWGLGLTLAGWLVLSWAHQRGGSRLGVVAGTLSLFAGGVYLVDGGGQIDPRWYLVLPSVMAVLFFYLLAMPTVQRARLSTVTIGRESLVGLHGRAVADFTPDGVVEVAGARWRATAHREAGLVKGSEVTVTGVDGLYLEVDPAPGARET